MAKKKKRLHLPPRQRWLHQRQRLHLLKLHPPPPQPLLPHPLPMLLPPQQPQPLLLLSKSLKRKSSNLLAPWLPAQVRLTTPLWGNEKAAYIICS